MAHDENEIEIENIASYIDHTLLKPEATREQIRKLCEEALEYRFAAVCVNPANVRLCAELLEGSGVEVCTVIGFPLGANLTEVKVYEAQKAVVEGAKELDMVINLGALKGGDLVMVKKDVAAVTRACHDGGAICKVIIEAAALTDDEKVSACRAAMEAGADFVKTSTGFNPAGGATLHDVEIMRRTVGDTMGVKAAGGIRTLDDALKMIRAGASRLGASAGVKIVGEAGG